MVTYFTTAAVILAEGLSAADGRDLAWRQQRNRVRSAVWAFNAVPWVDELTIDHLESRCTPATTATSCPS